MPPSHDVEWSSAAGPPSVATVAPSRIGVPAAETDRPRGRHGEPREPFPARASVDAVSFLTLDSFLARGEARRDDPALARELESPERARPAVAVQRVVRRLPMNGAGDKGAESRHARAAKGARSSRIQALPQLPAQPERRRRIVLKRELLPVFAHGRSTTGSTAPLRTRARSGRTDRSVDPVVRIRASARIEPIPFPASRMAPRIEPRGEARRAARVVSVVPRGERVSIQVGSRRLPFQGERMEEPRGTAEVDEPARIRHRDRAPRIEGAEVQPPETIELRSIGGHRVGVRAAAGTDARELDVVVAPTRAQVDPVRVRGVGFVPGVASLAGPLSTPPRSATRSSRNLPSRSAWRGRRR